VALALPAVAAGAAGLGLLAAGWMYASSSPTSQIFGRTLVAGDDPHEVALTFDDGPNDVATPRLLELLARHKVRATFFSIGNFARLQPALVREIVAAGHLLCNHTMTHPRLSTALARRVRQELGDCSALLEDIAGVPMRYFRPPFGSRRPVVLRLARELGLTPVMWNVTGFDWEPIGAGGILRNLERGLARNRRRRKASNLLLHDGGHSAMGMPRLDTVRAVEQFLATHPPGATRYVTVDAWSVAQGNA
jgi:peptidoglycan/xylan/chitin deacetylase (PgdA/CDA1 family)